MQRRGKWRGERQMLEKNELREELLREQERTAGPCAICLEDFNEGDVLRLLPCTQHGFHVECADAWLLTSADKPAAGPPRCPLCNRPAVGE